MNNQTFFLNSLLTVFIVVCFAYALADISVPLSENSRHSLNEPPAAVGLIKQQSEKDEVHYHPMLQADFKNLTFEEADKLGLIGGVKLVRLSSGILQEQTLIKEGFVISELNGKTIYSVEEFFSILAKTEGSIRLKGSYDDLLQDFDDFEGKFEYEVEMNRLPRSW